MTRRKLRNASVRRKALFGADTGAIIAAAGINVAGTMAGAALSAKASKDAARDQAAAINANAQRQAQAIREQTERSREYQQMSQDFIKEQNAENRELQKDIQMQLQMLTGQQNVNDRLEASKIQVKYGGSSSTKRKVAGLTPYDLTKHGYSLRGNNMPFTVTDGGGVIPLGTTPEGFDLYELYGNDHEHYHKGPGGKSRTGVGLKFADGSVVEGEGNQNGFRGEKVLITPNNAYFISKHTIGGFNPAKSVEAGMNPVLAYNVQERIKTIKGLSDDGKGSSPVKAMMGGNYVYDMTNASTPFIGTDTVGDTATAIAAKVHKLRNGGSCRRKAPLGTALERLKRLGYSGLANAYYNISPIEHISENHVVRPTSVIDNNSISTYPRHNYTGQILGAGITGLGNIGGALITSLGNRSAAKTLAGAYNKSSRMLADAYNALRTVDINNLKRDDFKTAHAMPALQAPVSQAASQLAVIDRGLQSRISRLRRHSTSSSAMNAKANASEIEAQDLRNKAYSADQELMQKIRQGNAERVTQAAMENAELDSKANKDFTASYLDMLKYNNDIENSRILGAANAYSEGALGAADAISKAKAANAEAWANATLNTATGFGNTFASIGKARNDYENVLIGADMPNKVSTIVMKNDRRNAAPLYNNFKAMASDLTLAPETRKKYAEYAAMLRNAFNFS